MLRPKHFRTERVLELTQTKFSPDSSIPFLPVRPEVDPIVLEQISMLGPNPIFTRLT
jgi:hypothetical protein